MSDLISRQAAIDICTNAIDLWHGQLGEGALVAVQRKIKALPPVQSEPKSYRMGYQAGYAAAQRWIPCSERLPGKDESFYVLCCDKYGEIMIGNVFECYDGETPYSAESENEYMYDCVAWMPLPKPAKIEG